MLKDSKDVSRTSDESWLLKDTVVTLLPLVSGERSCPSICMVEPSECQLWGPVASSLAETVSDLDSDEAGSAVLLRCSTPGSEDGNLSPRFNLLKKLLLRLIVERDSEACWVCWNSCSPESWYRTRTEMDCLLAGPPGGSEAEAETLRRYLDFFQPHIEADWNSIAVNWC